MPTSSKEDKFTKRKDKVTDNLLEDFGILVEAKQKATAYNSTSGIFRAERVSLGTTELYEQIASSTQLEYLYKTVIIADSTIPNHFIDENTLRETVHFVQTLCDFTDVYIWNGHDAILLNPEDVDRGEFARLSQIIQPITPQELKKFRATHNLQLNNSILLDNRNFQMMSHALYTGQHFGKKEAHLSDVLYVSRKHIESREIGPRFTTFEFLSTMEAGVRKKFAASLDSQDQPLHLLVDLDTSNEQFLSGVPLEFNRVIIYFRKIPEKKLAHFVQFVSLIPKPKLIGLVQLHDSHQCSFISDKAIAQIATQSPYLQYLSLGFCYENIEESLAALDLQNHFALKLFSLVEVRDDPHEENHRSNTQLHNSLLEKLPNNLISLTLPYWVFGFESAQDHIGSRMNRLKTLAIEPHRIHEYGCFTDELGEYTARYLWPSPISFSLVSESGNPVQKIIMKQTTGFLNKGMRQWFAFEVPLKQPEFRPLVPQIQELTSIRHHRPLGNLRAHSYSHYICDVQREAPEELFESYWIDIEIDQSWEKAWQNLSAAFQKTEQEKIRESVSIRLSYRKKTENLWYLKKILSLFTQYFPEVDNLILRCDITNFDGVEVPLALSPLANLISDLNIARWSMTKVNWGRLSTTKTFAKEVNENNDFYQKVANPTYYYRNLFTCLNNKAPREIPNYYIINTQNTQPDYVEIHAKYQSSMESLGLDNRQIPASEGDLFLAKYDYKTTNHKAKWIFVALPVPGPNTELLEFYCNTPYRTLYFCQNSRQYFAWVYSKKAQTEIQFGYVLLSRPSQYLLSAIKTHSLAESDADLRLMRLLRFEKNAHDNSVQVTADSMRRFITTYQNQGLSLEHVLDIIVRYFRNFKDETLEVSGETDNIDMALFTQRRGVCRHRAKLSFKIYKALLAQLGEAVSSQYAFTLVINDLHAFLIQTKRIFKNTSSPEIPQIPLSISDSPNIWEDPFQESTPWELDPLQANNSMDIDLGFGSFFTDEPWVAPEQPETQVTVLCLGGGEEGQVISLTQEGSITDIPDSSASSQPKPYQQHVQSINVQHENVPNVTVQNVSQSNRSQDLDILKLDNPFLKPYQDKVFLTKESFCLWLAQYQQPRPMLLVIDDWKTWSKTKRVIRHSMQDRGRLFASISNFDDISLTKLPDMSTMPLQTFADITSTQRPLSSLGKMLKDSSANNPVLWVDIRDYSPALINPLFDHRRLLKGLQVPEHVTRIAVIDKAQFQEMGDDFISRFGKVVYTKLDFTQEEQKQRSNSMDSDLKQAEFYFDDPQQSFGEFAGKFEFYGEEIHYIRGWLELCLKEGIEHITLSNCPVGMTSFDNLLRDLEEGVLPTPFAEYPVHFNITYSDEKRQGNYNRLQLALGRPQNIDFVLHANSFPTFVGTPTALDSQGRFITQKSYLDCTEQDTLHLLVLGELSDEQWLRLDTYSNKYEKSLCLYFTAEEEIPSFLQVDREEFSKAIPTLAKLCPDNINWVSYPEGASPQTFASRAGIYIDPFDSLDSLIGKIQKANTPSGFTFQESILVQRLRQGEELYLFGSPNPEVLSFFTSLLCSTPHILVNGHIILIKQRISLCFTHQPQFALFDGESTTDSDVVMEETISSTPACMPEQLSASIAQHPILHLRHVRDMDGIALLMPTLRAMTYPLYREHREITTWLKQGGLFVINCLSEAPKDMLMLVRKFYYQQANMIFWDRHFYKTSPNKHRMLIVDYKDSDLLEQELKGITSQYLDSNTLTQDPENPVNAYYQKSNLSFYTQKLSAFMPIDRSLEMVDLLENPQVLYKDKAKRKAFWNDCYRVLEAMMTPFPMQASFIERLTPSQIPMALLLILHLQMKEALTLEPGNSRLARGLILEGPPGIGKTRVIFELLHALGYEDKLSLGNKVQSEKPGYVSAPTDDILICRQAIALARQHGYVLILDEINTLSYEENYRDCKTVMNQVRDFLSNTQTHSGILIASQNPSETFTGRNALNFLPYCFKAILPSASKQDYVHLAKELPRFSEKLAKQMKTASKLLSMPKYSSQFFPPNVRNYLAYIDNHNPAKRKDREKGQDEEPGSKKPRL